MRLLLAIGLSLVCLVSVSGAPPSSPGTDVDSIWLPRPRQAELDQPLSFDTAAADVEEQASDPLHLGAERMARMMEGYKRYAEVHARLSVGESRPSDIAVLEGVKATLAHEWFTAPYQMQERLRSLYFSIIGLFDADIARLKKIHHVASANEENEDEVARDDEFEFEAEAAQDEFVESAEPLLTNSDFLREASSGDLFEIESSEYLLSALPASDSSQVGHFAARMIRDHRVLHSRMLNALRASGTATPTLAMMKPEARKMLRALQAVAPSQVKQLYFRQQLVAHEQALAMYRAFMHSHGDPALVRLAKQAEPLIAEHTASLKRIMSRQ